MMLLKSNTLCRKLRLVNRYLEGDTSGRVTSPHILDRVCDYRWRTGGERNNNLVSFTRSRRTPEL